MKRFESIDDPNAQQIISIWEKSKLDNSTRIMISFALGKIYDDCGRYDDAFKVYKVGNELKFKESRIDLVAWFNHIDRNSNVLNSPPMMTSQCRLIRHSRFLSGYAEKRHNPGRTNYFPTFPGTWMRRITLY